MATTDFEVEVRHDGRLYSLSIPNLHLPICQACGEKVFTVNVDRQVNDALRSHLKLLTPEQIRHAIKRVTMTQKEIAQRLGIAEATVSRWLSESQIQSRAMDNLLRAFFAFPEIRAVLCGESQDTQLGLADIRRGHSQRQRRNREACPDRDAGWPDGSNSRRRACRQIQDIVQTAGTTWGTGSTE
jgi:transcriptional regulator with XRE-family HTH domain